MGNVFGATDKKGFSEAKSAKFRLDSESYYHSFYMPALDAVKAIRLDPVNGPGEVELKSIVFKQGELVQRFDSREQLLDLLIPLHKTVNIESERDWLKISPQSNDPQILIDYSLLQINSDRNLKWVLIFVFVFSSLFSFPWSTGDGSPFME